MLAVLETIEEAAPSREELDRLLQQTGAGDRDAFGELYERTRGAVYGMTLSILHHAHDAQEVSQDVYIRIWENAASYRAKGTPMAWILTIARNEARMRLRSSSRQGDLSEEEWDAIPADAPGVTSEDRIILQEALGSLGTEEREVLLLHASGLKHREIADLLDMPVSTVLSKYNRGIKKLRARMEGG